MALSAAHSPGFFVSPSFLSHRLVFAAHRESLPQCCLLLIKDITFNEMLWQGGREQTPCHCLLLRFFLHIHMGHRGFHFLISRLMISLWSGRAGACVCVRACMCIACGDLPFFSQLHGILELNEHEHEAPSDKHVFFLTFHSYTTDVRCQTPIMHPCFCETTCCILPNSAHHPVVYSLPSPLLC